MRETNKFALIAYTEIIIAIYLIFQLDKFITLGNRAIFLISSILLLLVAFFHLHLSVKELRNEIAIKEREQKDGK